MRQLHPEAIAAIQSKALFSKAEEQLLSKVGSSSQRTLETFQDLLHTHPDAFYLARTAKALQAHWQLMKQYYLLEDQTGNGHPRSCREQSGVQVWEHVPSAAGAVACQRPVREFSAAPCVSSSPPSAKTAATEPAAL